MNKHILYLAAGSGSRFGSNKLLCPLEGKPLFRHGLDTLAALIQGRKDCDLTVVSRYGPVLEAARAAGARAVDSPDSSQGLSFTIRAGLSALAPIPPEDFLLFVAADQPRLGSGTAARLLDAACPGVLIAAACWESQPGNPVLFSAALLPELKALDGDQGGRVVLRRHWDRCILLPVEDPLELADADTPEALLALRQGGAEHIEIILSHHKQTPGLP